MKDVQATREACNPQKRTSSTLKHEFFNFFLLLWVTFVALLDSVPDSADQNHCESMQIRIHITAYRYP